MGSISVPLGPVVLNSEVPEGEVSVVANLPAGADRLECGPGCALADEMTLVLDSVGKLVTILSGHNQTKFGLVEGDRPFWHAQPYAYTDLVALDDSGKLLTTGFENAREWLLLARDFSYHRFRKFGAQAAWRIVESGDSMAAMALRAANSGVGNASPRAVGQFQSYERDAEGYLLRILDYRRAEGVVKVLLERDPNHRVTTVAYEVKVPDAATSAIGDATDFSRKVVVGYEDTSALGRVNSVKTNALPATTVTYLASPHVPNRADAKIDLLTTSTGAETKFTFRGDGRLATYVNPAGSGDRSFTFSYLDCTAGHGAVPDGTSRATACVVEQRDEDGFVKTTQFSRFPDDSNPNVPPSRVYVSAVGNRPNVLDGVVFQRNQGGYLIRRHHLLTKRTQRWFPSDGQVQGAWVDGSLVPKCVAERVDGPATDGNPAAAAALVGYAYRCFDEDGLVVRQVTRDGETRYTYLKEGHGPAPGRPPTDTPTDEEWWNTFGWAADVVKTESRSSLEAKTSGAVASMKTLTSSRNLTRSAAGGPATAVYRLETRADFGGGTVVTFLDPLGRAVGSISPGDLPGSFKEMKFDAFGNVKETTDPTTRTVVTHEYTAAGNLKSGTTNICSQVRQTTSDVEEDGNHIAWKTTRTSGPTTMTMEKRDLRTDGEYATLAETAKSDGATRFTRITTKTFSQKGGVDLGRTTKTKWHDGDEIVEDWAWNVRGVSK